MTLINISTEGYLFKYCDFSFNYFFKEYDKFLENKLNELNEKIEKDQDEFDSTIDENLKSSKIIKMDLNERAHLYKEVKKI